MCGPVAALIDGDILPEDIVAGIALKGDGIADATGAIGAPAAADDFAVAGNADVADGFGEDQAAQALFPAALPADIGRGILLEIGGAPVTVAASSILRVVLTPDLDAADQVIAGGHEDFAAAVDGAGIEGFLKGFGIEGGAVADHAELLDVKFSGSGPDGGGRGTASPGRRLWQEQPVQTLPEQT